jgi:hypothetical protein
MAALAEPEAEAEAAENLNLAQEMAAQSETLKDFDPTLVTPGAAGGYDDGLDISVHDMVQMTTKPLAVFNSKEWKGKAVELHSLKAAAHLNGRVGRVMGLKKGHIERLNVELQAGAGDDQPAQTVSVKPDNMKEIDSDAVSIPPPPSPPPPPPKRRPRPSAYMSARPGEYKAGYDWRAVYPGQQLPRGLEIIASLSGKEEDEPTLARIPRTWKLNVAVKEGGKAVAHTRVVMERTTTVKEVLKAVGNAVPMCFSSSSSGEPADLIINGATYAGDASDTAEKARLFGSEVTCLASQ